MLQTFTASHPLSTEPLKQSHNTLVVDMVVFRFISASTLTRRFPTVSFVAKYVRGKMSGRSVNHTNSGQA